MTAAAPHAAPSLEESLLSGLLCAADPERVREALAIARPSDFDDALLARIAQALVDLADRGDPIDLPTIHAALIREASVESRRAAVRLAELVDAEATGAHALHHARAVHRDALERREQILAQRLADPATPGDLRGSARREMAAIAAELGAGPAAVAMPLDLAAASFGGERLLALLDRPRPAPVEAARPVPGHMLLVIAPTMIGKTTLALWNAMARASGAAPWDGATGRPAGRVLIYSIDEAPEQVARRMHSLATFHPAGRLERYAERLVVIGPDREIAPEALDGLRFDDAGLATLTRWLAEAEAAGDPFAEVYVDAYADMLPLGQSENSNEEATRIGGALERLAVRFGPAVTMLHHAGKPKQDAGDEPDVRFLGRGASALAAKARVVASLEAVPGLPHLRRIRTLTNLGPAPRSVLFEVCDPDGPADELLFFRPAPEPQDREPGDFLAPGEVIPTNELARRLAGDSLPDDRDPPGELKKQAASLRERWREAGLVSVVPGKKGAKLIQLAAPNER